MRQMCLVTLKAEGNGQPGLFLHCPTWYLKVFLCVNQSDRAGESRLLQGAGQSDHGWPRNWHWLSQTASNRGAEVEAGSAASGRSEHLCISRWIHGDLAQPSDAIWPFFFFFFQPDVSPMSSSLCAISCSISNISRQLLPFYPLLKFFFFCAFIFCVCRYGTKAGSGAKENKQADTN